MGGALCLRAALLSAAFVGLAAQIAIPLPFTPVPLTLQTFGLCFGLGFIAAGAVIARDADDARRARLLRDHAQPEKYTHTEVGFNYRMGGFVAAALSAFGRIDALVNNAGVAPAAGRMPTK